MARLDDIKMMLSSLLKIKEPEQKVQDESEKSLKAEDGFDNDNPLAHTSLYRDELGNRLPNKLHVVPLLGRPVLPAQISTIQLNIEWLDIVTDVIGSSHHTFALFSVDESLIKKPRLDIEKFPKTGTVVRLLSARTGPDEINLVCEGVRRVSLIEVADHKKNLAQVRYPEIEYQLANEEIKTTSKKSKKELKKTLDRYAALDTKLRNVLKEQKDYAKSIGVDVVKQKGKFDFKYYLHSDSRSLGALSRTKLTNLFEFLKIDQIPQEQKDAIAMYLARPTREQISKLNDFYEQAVEVLKERSKFLHNDFSKFTSKNKALKTLIEKDESDSLNSAAEQNNEQATEANSVNKAANSAANNTSEQEPKTEANTQLSLTDLAHELTSALRGDLINSIKPAKRDENLLIGVTSSKQQLELDKKAKQESEQLNLDFIDRMGQVLDAPEDYELQDHGPNEHDTSVRTRLFKLIELIERKEQLESELAEGHFKDAALKEILEQTPKNTTSDENDKSVTGPNIGFLDNDTSIITFMPGREADEDLLLRLNEIQKEHELQLTKEASSLNKDNQSANSTDANSGSSGDKPNITEALNQAEGASLNILGDSIRDDGSTETSIVINSDNQQMNPELKEFLNYLMQGKDIAQIVNDDLSKAGNDSSKWGALQRAALIRSKLAALLGGKVIFGVSNVDEKKSGAQYDVELRAYCLGITAALQELLPLNPLMTDEMRQYLSHFDMSNPSVLADCAASITQSEPKELQQVLDTIAVLPRLKLTFELISRDLSAAKLQDKIKISVAEKIQKRQKDFFLKEQLNEIKKELGLAADEKDLDINKFKERMEKLTPPDYIKERFEDEISKLSMLETASPEYGQTRNYVDILTSIPWGKMAKERFSKNSKTKLVSDKASVDLERARKILDEDHEGLQDVKDRIIEFLAVGALKGHTSGQIMLFVGPPGVGKTSIGKSIARALNRPFYRLSLGGVDDVSEIKGHRRTYVGSMPGKIVSALRETKVMNPVIMLDEIDKLGRSYHGDPDSALLETLDPEQNKNFLDMYLDEKLDLSNCLFICTANGTDTISAPLLDRMDPIRLSGYIAKEKFAIAKKHLIPRAFDEAGLKKNSRTITIPDQALNDLIDGYARESGVRSLERAIDKLIRKAAVKIVQGQSKVTINSDDLEGYLGTAPFKKEKMLQGVGIMTGLAWTASGGVTLPVESIVTSQDTQGFKLTGSLGDVMKESANIAFSYVQANLSNFCTQKGSNFFKKKTVHLHVPEGAIPKDGPSAGVTMATSLLSLALNEAPKSQFAMTGELTLTGHVLPIGGLREKTIAARRMGIYELIIPIGNEGDVKELPEQVRANVTFYYADTYKDVAYTLFESVRPLLQKADPSYQGPRMVTFNDQGQSSEDQAKAQAQSKPQAPAKAKAPAKAPAKPKATSKAKAPAATAAPAAPAPAPKAESKPSAQAKAQANTKDQALKSAAVVTKTTKAKSATKTTVATKAKVAATAKAEPKSKAEPKATPNAAKVEADTKSEAKAKVATKAKAAPKSKAKTTATAETKSTPKASTKAAADKEASTTEKTASKVVRKAATKTASKNTTKATAKTKAVKANTKQTKVKSKEEPKDSNSK